MKLSMLLLLAICIGYTMAECPAIRTYDWDGGWVAADIVGVVIGFPIVAILLVYVVIRLFIEEWKRNKEFTENLKNAEREASNFDITYDQILKAEAEQKAKDKEEYYDG